MARAAFTFDAERPDAVRAADREAARLVVQVSDETRAAIRALVSRAIREGIPPYEAARLIRYTIGLTTRQAQAVANFREALINQGLVLEKVNQRVERYANKLLRQRAENIARTEIMEALNRGHEAGLEQAREEGLLPADYELEVVVTPDERLCPICAPLEGRRRKPGEDEGPPFHQRCRCTEIVYTPPRVSP